MVNKAKVIGQRQIIYVFFPPSLSASTPIESLPKILEKPIIERSKALSSRDKPTFNPCAAICVIVVNMVKKIQNWQKAKRLKTFLSSNSNEVVASVGVFPEVFGAVIIDAAKTSPMLAAIPR